MNNFRRRSLAKKKRTVVETYRSIDSFEATSINITNGTFRIDIANGSTAEISITVGYTATTYLYTRYDDGTEETSNPYTESGTVTFTEAHLTISDWFGNMKNWLSIGKTVKLGDGCTYDAYLSRNSWMGNESPIPIPELPGDEINTRLFFEGGYSFGVRYYATNTGTLYYVNISPDS